MKTRKLMTIALALLAGATSAQEAGGSRDEAYFGGGRVLVAYFSRTGNTQRVAQAIANETGADVFRIEPEVPYPSNYTECTEVALAERDNDARPAIANAVDNMADYDVVFIGCPVWWHTAPMIINTFTESYDFSGKTVVPFCTYASTYRDETLARIAELTPQADHLEGFGSRGTTTGVSQWLSEINAQWTAQQGGTNAITAPTTTGTDAGAAIYRINGTRTDAGANRRGIYIVKDGRSTRKVVRGK